MYLVAYIGISLMSYQWYKYIEKASNAPHTSNNIMPCNEEHFYLIGMESCYPYLHCKEINNEVELKETIGIGGVKLVKRGIWRQYSVVLNMLANDSYLEDFLNGLLVLLRLQHAAQVIQLLGFCEEERIFVTEFHSFGSLDTFLSNLYTGHYHWKDSVAFRLFLCQQYVEVIHGLHSLREGPRVMCDSNDIMKTLSQFLISEDFKILLNDADALPCVHEQESKLVKCGHRELFGEFVAPEQLWPYGDNEFDDERMPGYDERIDIWRVPDVCNAFLGNAEGSTRLKLSLLQMNIRCKSEIPSKRPSALEIVKFYKVVKSEFIEGQQ